MTLVVRVSTKTVSVNVYIPWERIVHQLAKESDEIPVIFSTEHRPYTTEWLATVILQPYNWAWPVHVSAPLYRLDVLLCVVYLILCDKKKKKSTENNFILISTHSSIQLTQRLHTQNVYDKFIICLNCYGSGRRERWTPNNTDRKRYLILKTFKIY